MMQRDIEERLLQAYENEWGHRPSETSEDFRILQDLLDVTADWDDPSEGLRSWGRALTEAGNNA